jgi:2-amino-4-hydroxy-6-hydroxymethyldihydropteridine diphosphokinase
LASVKRAKPASASEGHAGDAVKKLQSHERATLVAGLYWYWQQSRISGRSGQASHCCPGRSASVRSRQRIGTLSFSADGPAGSARFRQRRRCHTDQPDFVNAVAAILTQTNARDLLQQLQEIERRQGRDRSVERWGPRTLDLDLLAYGAEIINEGDLIVPHPGIADRNFVLLPWQEIAPNYRVPGRTDVAAMAASISVSEPRIERIGQ